MENVNRRGLLNLLVGIIAVGATDKIFQDPPKPKIPVPSEETKPAYKIPDGWTPYKYKKMYEVEYDQNGVSMELKERKIFYIDAESMSPEQLKRHLEIIRSQVIKAA